MTINDLTKGQLEELKIRYLDELLQETEDRCISFGEMLEINEIIADDDKDFIEEFSHYVFGNDDFFTSDRNYDFD